MFNMNIQSSSGYICSDKNRLASPEQLKCLFPFLLAFISMGHGRQSILQEPLNEVCFLLCFYEHKESLKRKTNPHAKNKTEIAAVMQQNVGHDSNVMVLTKTARLSMLTKHESRFRLFQDTKALWLSTFICVDEVLFDELISGANSADSKEEVISQKFTRQFLNLTWECCAEHDCLPPIFRSWHRVIFDDRVNLRCKTHVHTVGFVEHEILNRVRDVTTTREFFVLFHFIVKRFAVDIQLGRFTF
eukprot:284818640_4